MKFLIEYSGGPSDRVWHGRVIVEAENAAEAIHKIENEIACIPADIYAVNPHDEDPDLGPIAKGHVCKHGVRWPHECRPCDDAAWELEQKRISGHP